MCNYYSDSVYMFIILFNIFCSCATNKNRNMLALVFGRVRASCFGMISHDSTALWRFVATGCASHEENAQQHITTPKRQDKSMEIPKNVAITWISRTNHLGCSSARPRLPSISSILRWAKKIVGVGWFVAIGVSENLSGQSRSISFEFFLDVKWCETSLDCSYNGGTWAIPSQFCCRPRWPIWPWMLTRTRVKSRKCAVPTFPV